MYWDSVFTIAAACCLDSCLPSCKVCFRLWHCFKCARLSSSAAFEEVAIENEFDSFSTFTESCACPIKTFWIAQNWVPFRSFSYTFREWCRDCARVYFEIWQNSNDKSMPVGKKKQMALKTTWLSSVKLQEYICVLVQKPVFNAKRGLGT